MPISEEQRERLEHTIRARIEQLRKELESDVQRAREETYSRLSEEVPDTGDAAVADLYSDLANAETTRDLRELHELEAALDRMAKGTYGICVDCGGEIEPARLEAYPAATRCIRCQTIYEKTYAQPPAPRL